MFRHHNIHRSPINERVREVISKVERGVEDVKKLLREGEADAADEECWRINVDLKAARGMILSASNTGHQSQQW